MNRNEIAWGLKDEGLNPIVEQSILRTSIIRDGALIRASVMHESWYEDTIPNPEVKMHIPRSLKDSIPPIARHSFYSWFTRLYSPY